jgi:hypothetical protein
LRTSDSPSATQTLEVPPSSPAISGPPQLGHRISELIALGMPATVMRDVTRHSAMLTMRTGRRRHSEDDYKANAQQYGADNDRECGKRHEYPVSGDGAPRFWTLRSRRRAADSLCSSTGTHLAQSLIFGVDIDLSAETLGHHSRNWQLPRGKSEVRGHQLPILLHVRQGLSIGIRPSQ